eukprot:TRINITY_DN752_c0_g1_i1.p1 TRINITY_DN752_c0_g1~~TRINITY_DN752_c0_g1_i1.p1  ORF type:complete len:252 (-),score=39.21 TRINITY_DN752_c0_g1_i1:80-835(-)
MAAYLHLSLLFASFFFVFSFAQSCKQNNDCKTGQFCRFASGSCGGQGNCSAPNQFCPANYAPACGCDGRTYSNACHVLGAGVSFRHQGACASVCNATIPCLLGTICEYPTGSCGYGDDGMCVAPTTFCPPQPNPHPVCGCDGKNYLSRCNAALANMSVSFYGKCPVTCRNDSDCPQLTETKPFCEFAIGVCGASAGGLGLCTPRPESCFGLHDPVCGCDGVTYSNVCYAAAGGVNVRVKGNCGGVKAVIVN